MGGCCQIVSQDKYLEKFQEVGLTNEEPLESISNLFSILRKQIQTSAIYDSIISKYKILQILDFNGTIYLNSQGSLELLQTILDYMAFCKNLFQKAKHKLRTTLTQEGFSQQISQKSYSISQKTIYINKYSLRVLNYIYKVQHLPLNYHDHSFLDLKFDLSSQEAIQVLSVVRNLCYYDSRCFCFLTNYLIKSIHELFNSGRIKLLQVENKLKNVLLVLSKQIILEKLSTQDKQILNQHPNCLIEDDKISYRVLKLDNLQKYQKEKQLEKVIMQLHDESVNNLKNVHTFIEDICLNHEGYNFKTDVHISSHFLKNSLLEEKLKLKQKMIDKHLIEEYLKEKNAKIINDRIKQECQLVEQVVSEYFHKLTGQINIKNVNISAKCLFGSIHKVNKCCAALKEVIQKNKSFITLIQISNKLKDEQYPLISLKFKYNNLIVEINLLVDINILSNQLLTQIKHLRQPKAFSTLAELIFLNQKTSLPYLKELQCLIKTNVQSTKSYNYQQILQYQDLKSIFSQLINLLPVKLQEEIITTDFQDHQVKSLYKKCRAIHEFSTVKQNIEDFWYKDLNNGIFQYYRKNYDKSIEHLEEFIAKEEQNRKAIIQCLHNSEQNQENNKDILSKYLQGLRLLASSYKEKDNYSKFVSLTKKCLKIEEKIYGKQSIEMLESMKKIAIVSKKNKTQDSIVKLKECMTIQQKFRGKQTKFNLQILSEIGLAYRDQKNYNECLKYFHKVMSLQQKLSGKQSLGIAIQSNNMGLVYYTQGNSSEALKHYFKYIEIHEKCKKGSYNFELASILNNVGSIYFNQNNYPLALQYYFKSLDIKQKTKGKLNIDYALTLNNIGSVYKNQKNLQEALKYFQFSLYIKQKLKGPDSLQAALILNNIGSVFKHQHKYQEALQTFYRSLEIKEKVKGKENQDCPSVLYNIGCVYSTQKKTELALKHFLKAEELIQKHKLQPSFKNKLLNLIVKCYKALNNTTQYDSYNERLKFSKINT